MKNYTEMSKLDTFEDRFNYLSLNGVVGDQTFGAERYLNQDFYHNDREWKRIRDKVIIRDSANGYPCDLGCPDHPIIGERIIIHHIQPIQSTDILGRTSRLTDLNNLVCTTDRTHNAIHYGSFESLPKDYIPRKPNDTIPWR